MSGQLLKIAVNGAAGRMGREVIKACHGEFKDAVQLVAALEAASSPHVGKTAGSLVGIPGLDVETGSDIKAMLKCSPDVLIDFSVPGSTIALLPECVAAGLPLVTGTTGWDSQQQQKLQQAGESLPMVVAANMSVGVNLCLSMLEQAAAVLADADTEILEIHHNQKKDAPSGTALAMGRVIAAATGSDHDAVAVYGRSGEPRQPGSIGYASLRIADSTGEHTVMFGTPGERVELSHKALNRGIFACGALRAASWLVGRPAGVYGMREVLGLPLKPRD